MKIKEYLKKYGIKLAVIVIAAVLIVSLIGSSAKNSGFLAEISGSISAPVERAASAMINWLEGIYGYLYKYDRLVEENESLRAQIVKLQDEARNYDEVEDENARLRELLNLREKHSDFVFESAKIVDWDSSNYSSAFTISKGESSGIELYDCVVTEYGVLVGQVIELGSDWATVRTIIDVNTDVGALFGENSYAGMVTGEYALMKQGLTRISYVSSGVQLLDGDEVLTSGKGGTFPAGLLIGSITSVMTEAGGQTTYGVVTPACNLDTLSQVFIIKDYEIVE